MANILTMNKFEEVSRAKSFQELWRALSNDQLFELCKIFKSVFDRDLDPLISRFANATTEDWSAMTALIGMLGSSITRLNSVICNLNWDNDVEINAAIEGLRREATGHSRQELAVTQYLAQFVRDYQVLREHNTIGHWGLFEFRATHMP